MNRKTEKKLAVFPGSFDPITTGHVDIIERALPLFDKIVVAVGINSQKKALYSLSHRLEMLETVFAGREDRIEIAQFEGLTAHYCREIGARFLLRGIRSSADFEYEKTISQLNNVVGNDLETIFFISRPQFSYISSTIVREIIKGDGDVSSFVPNVVNNMLKN